MTEQLDLVQQRNDLAAIVTHDLKNHLFGETGAVGSIGEKLSGNVSAEQRRACAYCKPIVTGSCKIIDRLMEIYRYEIGVEPLHFEITDITPCLGSSIDEVLPSLKANGLAFASSLSPTLHPVSADVQALHHVLTISLGTPLNLPPAVT